MMEEGAPRRRKRRLRERAGARSTIAIVASIAANLLIVWILTKAGAFDVPREPARMRPVSLAPLTARDWAANRAIISQNTPRAPAPRPPTPPPAPTPPPLPDGKIVELPPDAPGKNQAPADARYLSDRDRKVDKETVSKYASSHEQALSERPQAGSPGRAGASAPPPAPPPQPATPPQPPQSARAAAPAPERAKTAEGAQEPRGADAADKRLALAPKLTPHAGEPGESDAEARAQGKLSPSPGRQQEAGAPPAPAPQPQPRPQDEGVVSRRDAHPDLSLSPETMARIARGPGMAGYNENEEGEFTALNTRDGGALARWGMRLQRQVGSAWDKIVQHEMRNRDPSGEIFFYKERTVVLGVVLDAQGNLKDVSVVRSSNVQFFDETALAAIRQAQPYEAPPQSLFTEGVARFPFRFTFYPERRSIFIGKPMP